MTLKWVFAATLLAYLQIPAAFASAADPWTDPHTGRVWVYAGDKTYADAAASCARRNAAMPDFQSVVTALRDGIANRGVNTSWREGEVNTLELGQALVWTTSPSSNPGYGVAVDIAQYDHEWSKAAMAHAVCLVGSTLPPPPPPPPPPSHPTYTVWLCRTGALFFATNGQFSHYLCGFHSTSAAISDSQGQQAARDEGNCGSTSNPGFSCSPMAGTCFKHTSTDIENAPIEAWSSQCSGI